MTPSSSLPAPLSEPVQQLLLAVEQVAAQLPADLPHHGHTLRLEGGRWLDEHGWTTGPVA